MIIHAVMTRKWKYSLIFFGGGGRNENDVHPNLDIYVFLFFLSFLMKFGGWDAKEKKRKEKNVSALSLFPPLDLFPAPPLTTHLAII